MADKQLLSQEILRQADHWYGSRNTSPIDLNIVEGLSILMKMLMELSEREEGNQS